MMNKLENVNFRKFEDEFDNLLHEFEVVKYEKMANDEWVEHSRFESGRSEYIVDGQLYFRLDNALISLNMDFNSPTCGACYQIGKTIENKRKIIGNEVLLKNNLYSLCRQNYLDGTCFYTLQDKNKNWNVEHGSDNITELIEQLEHEIKINSSSERAKYFINNKAVQEVYFRIKNDMESMVEYLRKIA
jgi:hypothetical protein